MTITRRHNLIHLAAGGAWLGLPALAVAVQRKSLADPLRLAADDALVDSGLGPLLQRAFGRDTGVAVELLRDPAAKVLQALERGEHDAALTNAPAIEMGLEKQGLLHDRRTLAASEFILVGPAALAKPLAAGHDIALALSRLAQAKALFVSRGDGSGTHLAEQSAWLAAATAPAGEWYLQADAGKPLLAQARERQACAIVERGVWAAQGGGKGMAVLADGDPRLSVDVHVMRAFRIERQHPAGKLFVGWITGPRGRRLLASQRGYQAPRG